MYQMMQLWSPIEPSLQENTLHKLHLTGIVLFVSVWQSGLLLSMLLYVDRKARKYFVPLFLQMMCLH